MFIVMYNFEKRMRDAEKSFELFKKEHPALGQDHEFHLNNFIILARSVTFIMQKDLKNKNGFSNWYELKKEEMRIKGFVHFIEKRNTIEKEGISPVRGEIIKISFIDPVEPGSEIVGEQTKNGLKSSRRAAISRNFYFGKPGDERTNIIPIVEKYISYLKDLVKEAKEKFPEDNKS